MIQFVLEKVFGTQNSRTLKQVWPIVHKVSALEPEIQKLSDEALKAKTEEFRSRLAKGQTLDDILVEAFAVSAKRRAAPFICGISTFKFWGGLFFIGGPLPRWPPVKEKLSWQPSRFI